MSSWWLVWIVFMFLFLVSPIGYGWGYRKWGPPYPRFVQQRRATAQSAAYDHRAWGWRADLLWLVFVIGLFWAAAALWWHR